LFIYLSVCAGQKWGWLSFEGAN